MMIDGAGRLLALDDKQRPPRTNPGPAVASVEDLADEGLVLATLVVEVDGVVDVRVPQFDQHLLVDAGTLHFLRAEAVENPKRTYIYYLYTISTGPSVQHICHFV